MSITGPQALNWLAGRHPGGARFCVGEAVTIDAGACMGQAGVIVTLAELEPEPVYLVALERGHYIQTPESSLIRR